MPETSSFAVRTVRDASATAVSTRSAAAHIARPSAVSVSSRPPRTTSFAPMLSSSAVRRRLTVVRYRASRLRPMRRSARHSRRRHGLGLRRQAPRRSPTAPSSTGRRLSPASMCAIRRAVAELRLAANPQPHFPALLDDGRFTPTPKARPRQAFPHDTAYDGLLSRTRRPTRTWPASRRRYRSARRWWPSRSAAPTRKPTPRSPRSPAASYVVPVADKRLPDGGILGLSLVVQIGDELPITRTLAGLTAVEAGQGVPLTEAAAAHVRETLLGTTLVSFEGGAPSTSTWVDDYLTGRLSTRPLHEAISHRRTLRVSVPRWRTGSLCCQKGSTVFMCRRRSARRTSPS